MVAKLPVFLCFGGLLAFFACSYTRIPELAEVHGQSPAPLKTTICEVKKDPEKFNRKLIEVTGFVSRGFEDSSLFDFECRESQSIWVDIGGKGGTGVMYCCNVPAERTRSDELTVEEITLPLTDDETFRRFDSLLQEEGNSIVRAHIVGTFFAGRKTDTRIGTMWMGYGHMGMSSLFVIQEVLSVDSNNREGFDTSSSIDFDDEGCGTYSHMWDPKPKQNVGNQELINRGEAQWRVDNPVKVATEGLLSVLGRHERSSIKLKELRRAKGKITYRWSPRSSDGARYIVVVSRPYWLSFYADNAAKTAWVVSEVVRLCD